MLALDCLVSGGADNGNLGAFFSQSHHRNPEFQVFKTFFDQNSNLFSF
jgi:hypothetical protein